MPDEQEKRWIAAWKLAGPKLQEIREEELRGLDEDAGLKLLGARSERPATLHGLAVFEAWMMRWRILEMQKRLDRRD